MLATGSRCVHFIFSFRYSATTMQHTLNHGIQRSTTGLHQTSYTTERRCVLIQSLEPMTPNSQEINSKDLDALLQLALAPRQAHSAMSYLANLCEVEWDRLVAVAEANHVVIRAFRVLADQTDGNHRLADAAAKVLAREELRIDNALTFLRHICDELEQAGCATTVMKSLDHWPDLGSDLDLYTSAEPRRVIRVMLQRLGARIGPRSWGDRVARKWNFIVPGLP